MSCVCAVRCARLLFEPPPGLRPMPIDVLRMLDKWAAFVAATEVVVWFRWWLISLPTADEERLSPRLADVGLECETLPFRDGISVWLAVKL